MRRIVKNGTGGYFLDQANKNPPKSKSEATSRWGNFSHKKNLMDKLLMEQYGLCCYSEIRADEEFLGHHIEHVENKSQNPERTFDYLNLAACALNSENDLPKFKSEAQEIFGGHSNGKQKNYNIELFVSCHEKSAINFFIYLSDGRVEASSRIDEKDRNRVEYTIELLNLNSPFLVTRRRQWWQELESLFEQHQVDDWNLYDLAAIDLTPSSNKLSRFFSLTRQFFGPVAEHAIKLHGPKLL